MRRSLVAALVLCLAFPAYAKTVVTCADGTTSKSGRGACSHHGGVAAGAPAPDTGEKPSGTAYCADGTTSKAGRGACSRHGGVVDTKTPVAKMPESPRATVPTKAGAPKSGKQE